MRTEYDALGSLNIPYEVPRGIYTERVRHLYPRANIFSVSETFLRTYIEAKMIYATVNQKAGKITPPIHEAIQHAGTKLLEKSSPEFMSFFPLGHIQSGGGTSTNMVINEILANLATVELGGSYGDYLVNPHDHINASQSSNDTFPGVTKITCLKFLPTLLGSLKELEKTFNLFGRKRKKIQKVGRTHLQDAVVISLGDEFHAYAHTIQKNRKYIEQAMKSLYELNFGGTATGSLQNITPEIRTMIIEDCRNFFTFPFVAPANYFEQNSSSGDFAHFSGSLTHLANDLIKIGNDLRLLSSGPLTGFYEITLPAVQPGSSIMPGKINPSVIEALTMVCARVIGNDTMVQLLTRQAQLELQQFMPGITWAVLESIKRLAGSVALFHDYCVKNIKPNRGRISHVLENSFAYATNYTEKYGYEIVAQAVVKALKTGKELSHILEEFQPQETT